MSFLKKLFKASMNKKYRKNPNDKLLTKEKQRALNIGAINSEQVMYFCNSLETGESREELEKKLFQYYSIYDPETALEKLEWLKLRGQRIYFSALVPFVIGRASCIDDSLLTDEEKVNTYQFLKNLKANVDILLRENCIQTDDDLLSLSVLAWDMGRLVLIARCCYDLGYISEETAWLYIMDAYEQSSREYSDWDAFAKGYLSGRSMISSSQTMLNGISHIITDLLNDEDSPWKQYNLIYN